MKVAGKHLFQNDMLILFFISKCIIFALFSCHNDIMDINYKKERQK